MKFRKSLLVFILVVLVMIIPLNRRITERRVVSEYYETVLYERLEGLSDYEKTRYYKSLDDGSIKVNVSDLRSLNSRYDKSLRRRQGNVLVYKVFEPFGINDYTFSFESVE